MELINHFERTADIFLAYVLNIVVLYNIYVLNIYYMYFLICFRLMKNLLIRTINCKHFGCATVWVLNLDFLSGIFIWSVWSFICYIVKNFMMWFPVFLITVVHIGELVCWWGENGSCSLGIWLLEFTVSWFTFWLRDQIFNLPDWTETSIIFHHVFNPIGLMLLGIHVREIANN